MAVSATRKETMSYDKIRIQHAGQKGEWIERQQAAKMNMSEQFVLTCNRLYTQGNYVELTAGKNYCCDELFLFEAGADAQDFYDSKFLAWESFPKADDEGCGYQEVSLYICGRHIATKSCPPSMRLEVRHE
jgi:hypothetical protein